MKTRIIESREARTGLDWAPAEILRAYEVWARLIEEHGSRILWGFKGYNNEMLSGVWAGYYSSRLNRKWRVIYKLERGTEVEVVSVVRVTAHDYRRSK